MNKVIILCDSTCDITPELLKEFGVEIFPLTVNFSDGTTYKDSIDITTTELYRLMEEKNEIAKTSAITLGDFYNIFEKYTNEGYDIVYTGIGSKFSSSFNNACNVAKDFEGRVEVVDSDNLSSGIGLLLHKGYLALKEGKNAKEVAEVMRSFVSRVKSQFVLDKLDYLHKGGRCSALKKFFATALRLHPIIEVRNGSMGVGQLTRGKLEVGCDKLVEMIKNDKENVEQDLIFITHSCCPEYSDYIYPRLRQEFPNARIEITTSNAIVSTHCGPNTIGILWISK